MRPTEFLVGNTIVWPIFTLDPDTEILKDADSTPTITVYKNGTATGESVTVTKRSATTGIYDCSFNPSGDAAGDVYRFEESATVTGTTTSSATYKYPWSCICVAIMRGTDGALTTLGTNAPASWINAAAIASSALDGKGNWITTLGSTAPAGWIDAAAIAANALTAAKFASGAFDAVWTVGTRTITGTVTLAASQPNYAPAKAGDAMSLTTSERTAVANEVEAQIIDDTDTEKVLQAITDKIAAANPSLEDLTLAAIAAAVRSELAVELALIDIAVSTRGSQTSINNVYDKVDTEVAAALAAADAAKTAAQSADLKLDTRPTVTQLNAVESNIRGADNDTLKTLSDQLDTKPTAVQVRQEMDSNSTVFTDLKQMIINDGTANAQWSAKAQELGPSGSSSLSEDDIAAIVAGVKQAPNVSSGQARLGVVIIKGDRLLQEFAVAPGTYTKLVWALKRKASDPDSAALLLVDSEDGITVVNGSAATAPQEAMGTLTYSSDTVTLDVDAEITTLLPVGVDYVDGIKTLPGNRHLRNYPTSTKVIDGVVQATE